MPTFQSSISIHNSDKTMGKVRDLKSVAVALNENSDKLQTTLKMLNEKLAELHIGVEAWLSEYSETELFCVGQKEERPLSRDSDETLTYRRAWDLGYCRIGEQWCIAARQVWFHVSKERNDYGIQEDIPYIDPDDERKSLLSAPRHVRIAAAGKISKLIDVIKVSADQLNKGMADAAKVAEDL